MILVTGGTGLVGKHLVRELVKKGNEVRCLVRSLEKAGQVLPPGVELVRGDITDNESVKRACRGVDRVFHLVAVIREKGESTFEHINVEGTLNLVIAAGQAGVKHFVHMSALGACDNPRYKYAYSKWRGEETVKQSGLAWTIVRSSVIYGEGFGFFDRLIQSIKLTPRPFVPVTGKGTSKFQPNAVVVVARCLVKIMENPSMKDRVVEIGGPEHLSYDEMLDLLLARLGEKRYKLHVPMALMRFVVPLMSRIMRDPPVTPVELKQMELDNITDSQVVEKMFGFKPKALRNGLSYIQPAER